VVAGRKPTQNGKTQRDKPFVATGKPDALPVEPVIEGELLEDDDPGTAVAEVDGRPVLPPEVMSPNGAKIWSRLLPDLIGTGVFRESDGLLLVELCETLAEAQEFRRALRDEEDKSSQEAKRLRSGYLASMKLVMQISGEFGISPVARLRLGLMKVQGTTLLAALGGDDD
jgi:phage terminase small subunit